VNREDPETPAIKEARLAEFRRQFTTREISLHLFRARLHMLGLRGQAIQNEVFANWPSPQKGRPT